MVESLSIDPFDSNHVLYGTGMTVVSHPIHVRSLRNLTISAVRQCMSDSYPRLAISLSDGQHAARPPAVGCSAQLHPQEFGRWNRGRVHIQDTTAAISDGNMQNLAFSLSSHRQRGLLSSAPLVTMEVNRFSLRGLEYSLKLYERTLQVSFTPL